MDFFLSLQGDGIIVKQSSTNRFFFFFNHFKADIMLLLLSFRNACHGIHSTDAVYPRRKKVYMEGSEPLPRQSRTETDCSDDVIGRLMLERLHAGRELQTAAALHGSSLFSGSGGPTRNKQPSSRPSSRSSNERPKNQSHTFGDARVCVFGGDDE